MDKKKSSFRFHEQIDYGEFKLISRKLQRDV